MGHYVGKIPISLSTLATADMLYLSRLHPLRFVGDVLCT